MIFFCASTDDRVIKNIYHHSLSKSHFRFLDFWAVQTSKAAAAAGSFEQLPQLLGHSNGCPRTSKRQLCFEISMLVVAIEAANVSSAAAAVRFCPPIRCCSQCQQIPCRAWCWIFTAIPGTTALSPKLPAPPPAPPRRRGSRCCCCCYCCLLLVSILRKFLKVKNRLSVVMTRLAYLPCYTFVPWRIVYAWGAWEGGSWLW